MLYDITSDIHIYTNDICFTPDPCCTFVKLRHQSFL